MIKIEFTEKDIKTIQYERYHHPHPRVQLKMEVLWLKSQNLPHNEICRLASVTGNTLRKYLADFQEGGLEKIMKVNFYRPQSELAQHEETIKKYFEEHPVASMNEAAAIIEKLTGIRRSVNRVRDYLKSIGIKRRKIGMIPAKADVKKQEEFVKEKLEPRIEEARKGLRQLFFMDAAHFVLAPFLGYLWCFVRVFIKAPAGRQRFNVLGALNAVTHELITVCNDSYINAKSVCELLELLAEQSIGVPITIVLDNARYQNCYFVRDYAASLNIELLFLPPYSPNLNLIERLWKFVKKKCLWSKYYSDFNEFKAAITDCLKQTHTTYKDELKSLLNPKFQTFKNVQVMGI